MNSRNYFVTKCISSTSQEWLSNNPQGVKTAPKKRMGLEKGICFHWQTDTKSWMNQWKSNYSAGLPLNMMVGNLHLHHRTLFSVCFLGWTFTYWHKQISKLFFIVALSNEDRIRNLSPILNLTNRIMWKEEIKLSVRSNRSADKHSRTATCPAEQ